MQVQTGGSVLGRRLSEVRHRPRRGYPGPAMSSRPHVLVFQPLFTLGAPLDYRMLGFQCWLADQFTAGRSAATRFDSSSAGGSWRTTTTFQPWRTGCSSPWRHVSASSCSRAPGFPVGLAVSRERPPHPACDLVASRRCRRTIGQLSGSRRRIAGLSALSGALHPARGFEAADRCPYVFFGHAEMRHELAERHARGRPA